MNHSFLCATPDELLLCSASLIINTVGKQSYLLSQPKGIVCRSTQLLSPKALGKDCSVHKRSEQKFVLLAVANRVGDER